MPATTPSPLHAADVLALDQSALQATLDKADDLSLTLVANSRDCIKILNTEGDLIFMSEGGKCAMDVDDFETLRGKPWAHGWPAEVAAVIPDMLSAAIMGESRSFCAGTPTLKGVFKVWDVTVAPIYTPLANQGEAATTRAITRLVAVSRDVTDLWALGLRPDAVICAKDWAAAAGVRSRVSKLMELGAA